jgi:osmoprotectant transport system permease protein
VGTATVAAVIGGGGLGDLIFIGLKLNKNYIILTGALLTALIAIIVDTFLAIMERRVTPKGLKLGR